MSLVTASLTGCDPEAVYVARDELLEAYAKPAWQADALCKEYPHISFFPERGTSTTLAKSVCGRCAVKAECLAFALEHRDKFGVWGGTSERERRKLRRQRDGLIVSSGY